MCSSPVLLLPPFFWSNYIKRMVSLDFFETGYKYLNYWTSVRWLLFLCDRDQLCIERLRWGYELYDGKDGVGRMKDSRKRITNVVTRMPVFSLESCHCTLKSPEHPRYHLYTTLVFMPHPFFLSLQKCRILKSSWRSSILNSLLGDWEYVAWRRQMTCSGYSSS